MEADRCGADEQACKECMTGQEPQGFERPFVDDAPRTADRFRTDAQACKGCMTGQEHAILPDQKIVASIPGLSIDKEGVYALEIGTSVGLVAQRMPMATRPLPNATDCNCLAVRQAARYITQFYDRYLAAAF